MPLIVEQLCILENESLRQYLPPSRYVENPDTIGYTLLIKNTRWIFYYIVTDGYKKSSWEKTDGVVTIRFLNRVVNEFLIFNWDLLISPTLYLHGEKN